MVLSKLIIGMSLALVKVGNTNYPEYYTEIMTKYKDGKLIYASVEPGLYHVSFSDAVENKDFTKVKNLNQLLKLNQSKPTI